MPGARRSFVLICLVLLLVSCDKIKFPAKQSKSSFEMPKQFDTILLKNGGVIQGKIVRETPQRVEIRWQDGIIGFSRAEIKGIKHEDTVLQGEGGLVVALKESRDGADRDPATYPRVYLTSGEVKKGVTVERKDGIFYLGETLQEGGKVEYSFSPADIEKIAFWPPPVLEPSGTVRDLQKSHSSFRIHEKSPYLTLSDDDPIDLNFCLKSLDQFYDEFIMYFLEFLRPDYSPRPLQAVIFGKEADFRRLLESAGFPKGASLLGFFATQTQVLFLYNIKSAEMINRYLYGSTKVEEQLKDNVENIAESYSGGDEIVKSRIMGAGERFLADLERNRLKVEREARAETVRTLRHEGAHQLLYEFDVHARKTRQGAWLVEGLASFCEPEEIGGIHETRLMELKYELEDHHLMPLEYLLSFAAGADIHHLEASYVGLAYSESWAFVHFLMSGAYREGFLAYVKEIPRQGKDFDEKKDIALLEKHLRKSVKVLEDEFASYVKRLLEEQVNSEKYEEFKFRVLLAK